LQGSHRGLLRGKLTGKVRRRLLSDLDPEVEIDQSLSWDAIGSGDEGEQLLLEFEVEPSHDLPKRTADRPRWSEGCQRGGEQRRGKTYPIMASVSPQPSYLVTALSCSTSSGSGDPRTQSSISSAANSDRALPSTTDSQPRWKARNCRATESTRMNFKRR
jgi:hypothetical protein